MNQTTVPYNEIEPKLQTGDILLAHGVAKGSLRIEALEHCPWSHVAMVVRAPNDEVLLWESTSLDNLEDTWLHIKKSGPQLVKLRDRLSTDVSNHYDTMFAIRHLHADRTPEMYELLDHFIEQVHDAVFPDKKQMYWEIIEGKFGITTSFRDFFCSKLVAETYIQLKLLSPAKAPNSYEPKDFTSKRHLRLLGNARLGDEIYIDVASILA
ncbi:hypothetical protein [Paenibacillus sp. HGF5]|uniref:hypothetical protein n=1 Tax=Paenibacillus sp. HGF5 TaxID=908341 RepID=UPI0002072607|nr:hypothetical protein [Paenibacillus sp. HGF5]EGG35438.1 conserved domain protein [Paenibacillus sp. HGF5]